MTCPSCNTNVPSHQAACHNCGRFIGLPIPEAPSGLRTIHWLVMFSVSVFLLGTGWFVYFFAHHFDELAHPKTPITANAPVPSRPHVSTAIEHGKVVAPSELH